MLKNQVRLVIVVTIFLAVLMVVSLSIAFQEPLYVAHSSLTTTYNTPFANVYWIGARFNNSQGNELAFFNFAFRNNNQSNGPVLTTLEFGPESSQRIYLDTVKLSFDTGNLLAWPDIGLRVPTNGFTPTQISRVNAQKVVISYENMGFYGQGTEMFDIWFGITIVSAALDTNHSLFLTIDITGHSPNPVLIGHSFSGEAVFQIVAQQNGLLYVADTAY